MSKRHCLRGHDTAVVGRYKSGNCQQCSRDRTNAYRASESGKERIRQYVSSERGRELRRRNAAKWRPKHREINRWRKYLWDHTTAAGATANNRQALRKAGRLPNEQADS